jgi:hypothetical protein
MKAERERWTLTERVSENDTEIHIEKEIETDRQKDIDR